MAAALKVLWHPQIKGINDVSHLEGPYSLTLEVEVYIGVKLLGVQDPEGKWKSFEGFQVFKRHDISHS